MLVIAFCGKKYSGKDEACNYLVSKYGFRQMDFSKDTLNPILEKEGKEITRDNQIELVTRLRKEKGIDILARLLAEKITGDSTISGLRYKEEAECLTKRLGKSFVLVAVEAADRVRYERSLKQKVKGEGGDSFGYFLEREKLPTEKVIPDTMKLADYSVANETTKHDLHSKLDEIMNKIKK